MRRRPPRRRRSGTDRKGERQLSIGDLDQGMGEVAPRGGGTPAASATDNPVGDRMHANGPREGAIGYDLVVQIKRLVPDGRRLNWADSSPSPIRDAMARFPVIRCQLGDRAKSTCLQDVADGAEIKQTVRKVAGLGRKVARGVGLE
jgi:hypothetical protein